MSYLKNRKKAFGYAFQGLFEFFKEPHARIHLIAFALVLVLGFVCRINPFEWVAILLVSGIVFIAEMINSALEHALDRLHPEKHESIRISKDVAAGAVLIAAILALMVGLIVFFPHLMDLLYV